MMRQVLRTMMVAAGVVLAAPQTGWGLSGLFRGPELVDVDRRELGHSAAAGITGGVLAAFASFFLYLLKRSRMAVGERVDLYPSSQAGSPS